MAEKHVPGGIQATINSDNFRTPASVHELTERNVALVAQLDATAKSNRTALDRVVDAITGFCGSMTFVWVHAIWFGFWLVINMAPFLPKRIHFDPYPFQLLTLVVSLEAIFLSTFILISQNRQSRLSERRNHLDLQINLLSEQENTKIISMLDRIQAKLGIEDADPEVALMEEATCPEELIGQIQDIIETEEIMDHKNAVGNNNGSKPAA